MYLSRTLPIFIACMAAGPVSAEYFGLPSGRTADLSQLPDSSIEFGFNTGDIEVDDSGDFDYQHIGGRLNYRLSPETMLFFDLGQSETGDADGFTYGIGAFYQMQGIFPSGDFALKFGYHRGEVEDGDLDIDVSGLSIEGLFSGKEPIGESDLRWYANAGIHRLEADGDGGDESGTEIGFGGGVYRTLDSGSGQVFGGIDLIDEMSFGIGYRHFLN